ncbi:GNAT family N-acetyltransferase [Pseudomonas protegens]|uniref:GNAT family N-acetyltransferase n=1 Tax=Pseudomonas protegens TaxID=380021 RepID=UPI00080702E3|nr:GNAT family N-acetyltransferase [Pseudomonas protegens]OBZ22926.1 GNAT family acetyltransferase [Pseudomonas protegens]OBZ30705.1 GNAT family acetyltransferase [Pseudomonas protegens]OKK44152.1 GNAT family N-acetyltransferase [Pseudomonas protegens]OKK50117.1 GNAT family N-acetyltransferase [Pseudomonas protegens]OKK56179.1 GNAT family N-acetyltransferase [Pseudomonas protegens]
MPASCRETARLLLRAPTLDDLPQACAIHGDPQTNRFNPNGPINAAACADKLHGWIEHWQQHGFGYWAIALRSDPQRLIGFGGIMQGFFGHEPGLNLYFRLRPEAWGQGYAAEMARAALHLAFSELHAPRVTGLVRPDNLPSRRALERLGLSLEGELDDFPGQAPSLLYRISAPDNPCPG